jgi:hypothetical protein
MTFQRLQMTLCSCWVRSSQTLKHTYMTTTYHKPKEIYFLVWNRNKKVTGLTRLSDPSIYPVAKQKEANIQTQTVTTSRRLLRPTTFTEIATTKHG